MNKLITANNLDLIDDIRFLINKTKSSISTVINSEMTLMYWHIGKRIKEEVLKDQRAEYGKQIIQSLSKNLSVEYGKGFTYSSLFRMTQFYDCFGNYDIVATLSQQLNWSHLIELLPIKDDKQRDFYAYMSIQGRWSVRELRSNIYKLTYERTAVSKDNSGLSLLDLNVSQELCPSLVLKDPYILNFLDLPDEHYENDLENAILTKIEQFILELGIGFSFVARQKRMTIDNDHFYLDLLFFNRKLKRLVAIELKTGRFKAEYKGQMELYLSWLKRYESLEGENHPIGIILCSEKSRAQIELLDMSASDIHVAEYWTELPPMELFEKKIQEIIIDTKRTYDNRPELEAELSKDFEFDQDDGNINNPNANMKNK